MVGEVPFFKPPKELGQGLIAMNIAYMEGHGTAGPEIFKFETELAKHWNVHHANVVATISGTHALELAGHTISDRMPIKRVAVPALTWNATANAAGMFTDGSVILMEVDGYGLMDLDTTRSLDVDCIMPVHLYGNVLNGGWLATLRDAGKKIIVDAAQAFEAQISPYADATCFSFHALKSLPIGIGGAVVFREHEDADNARRIRYHGCASGPGTEREQVQFGGKYIITAPAAAMGSALLPYVESWWLRRGHIAKQYMREFPTDYYVPRTQQNCWHAFVMLPTDPQKFRLDMKGCGVGCVPYYMSLADQPYWKRMNGCVRAKQLGAGATAIPLYPDMTQEEVEFVIERVKAYL